MGKGGWLSASEGACEQRTFARKSRLTVVKIEQEAAHVFVIHLASAVCLILGDDLAGKNRNISHKKV